MKIIPLNLRIIKNGYPALVLRKNYCNILYRKKWVISQRNDFFLPFFHTAKTLILLSHRFIMHISFDKTTQNFWYYFFREQQQQYNEKKKGKRTTTKKSCNLWFHSFSYFQFIREWNHLSFTLFGKTIQRSFYFCCARHLYVIKISLDSQNWVYHTVKLGLFLLWRIFVHLHFDKNTKTEKKVSKILWNFLFFWQWKKLSEI